MKQPRFSIVRFLQGWIMLGFSIYLIKLLLTGDVYKYVAPYFAVLLGITLSVLIVMSFYSLATMYRPAAGCDEHNCEHDHDHDHQHRVQKRWALIIAPVVLGLTVPSQSLGVEMISSGLTTTPPVTQVKGVVMETAAGTKTLEPSVLGATEETTPPKNALLPTEPKVDLTQIHKEIVPIDQLPPRPEPGSEMSMITLYSNILIAPEYFFNQVYRYQGMVYHPPGWPTDRMILVRYVISCCSADASPIGVTVEHRDAATYKDNAWIEIEGPLLTRAIPGLDEIPPVSWYYGQEQKPVVFARTIKLIEEPATPYLSYSQQ